LRRAQFKFLRYLGRKLRGKNKQEGEMREGFILTDEEEENKVEEESAEDYSSSSSSSSDVESAEA